MTATAEQNPEARGIFVPGSNIPGWLTPEQLRMAAGQISFDLSCGIIANEPVARERIATLQAEAARRESQPIQ